GNQLPVRSNGVHTIPRDEAQTKLTDRLQKAPEIVDRDIETEEDLERALGREERWRKYNGELLSTLFTTAQYADEYAATQRPVSTVADRYYDTTTDELAGRLGASIKSQMSALRSIIERLDLIPEGPAPITDAAMQGEQKLVLLIERFHRVAQQM